MVVRDRQEKEEYVVLRGQQAHKVQLEQMALKGQEEQLARQVRPD
jgi:hypothetical protein